MDKNASHATHFRVRAPILQEDEGGTVISAMGNTEYSGHTTIPHNQWRILPLVHFEVHPKGLGLENQKMGVSRSQQTGKLGM